MSTRSTPFVHQPLRSTSATDVLLQITAPHFCAGLIARRGKVVETAPILHFMVGWNGRHVADYCCVKGWHWHRITETATR